jgi:lipoate-protein ligase A
VNLPAFGFVAVHRQPLAAGIAHEADWMAGSATLDRPSAHLWTAPRGLVVPRRYTALPGWATASAEAANGRHGELQVRSSGGGVVPQGPGVWNLSLAWPAASATPLDTDSVYRGLSDALAAALARLGLVVTPQPVAGSFCDGRYNLAVGGAKLAGTAQAWRRVGGRPMVLAHAVVVVSADPAELTARANAFEAALGSATRYRAEAVTSVALACGGHIPDIEARTLIVLAEQFARVVQPRVFQPQETTRGSA